MALMEPERLFAHAIENHYGLAAFNVYSTESLLAVLEGAQAQGSAAIIQISMGARKYVKHLEAFVKTVRVFAGQYSVPVCIQHDHCLTVEDCKTAIDCGVQSVMFDGSHYSYEENISLTKQVVAYAQKHGVWVEAELGRLPGFEDLVFSDSVSFTDPGKINFFIENTGCSALAVAVGTSHGGVQADDYLPLDFELLQEILSVRPDYPFVLHGGASLPPELVEACNAQGGKVEFLRNCSEKNIRRAVDLGIRKVNMDVDNFLVFTTAVRRFLREHPAVYDPRKYLSQGSAAFQQEVEHKLKDVVNSSNRYR